MFTIRRSASIRLFCTVMVVLLAACEAIPVPEVDPGADAASAVGLAAPVLLSVSGGPLDESGDEASPLTLARAVERAVRTDPGLQAALWRVRAALAEAKEARVLPNPILDVILRAPTAGGPLKIEAGLSTAIASVLTRPGRSRGADARLRSAAASAVTTALDVVRDTRERYVDIQTIERILPVLDDRQRLTARLLALAQARLNAREGTSGDVTILDAQRIENDIDVADRQAALTAARLALRRLIGQPSATTALQVEAWQAGVIPELAEARWIAVALDRRPELQSLAFAITAWEEEGRLAGAAGYDEARAGVVTERDDGWRVGPAITVPLPLFDATGPRLERASALAAEARHQLVGAQRAVVEDVRQAFAALASVRANLRRVETELLPLVHTRQLQAAAAYEAGQADITPVLLAEQELRAAGIRRVELERAQGIAHLRLERAVGGPVVLAAPESRITQDRIPQPETRP